MKRVGWWFTFLGILFAIIALLCCRLSVCSAQQDLSGFASTGNSDMQSPKPLVPVNKNTSSTANSNTADSSNRAYFSSSEPKPAAETRTATVATLENSWQNSSPVPEATPKKRSFFGSLWGSSKEKGQEEKEKTVEKKTPVAKPIQESKPQPHVASENTESLESVAPEPEEELGWDLVHSDVLPFEGYFIDTRIVGAVRYHADFPLEREYEILRELKNIQKDLSAYLAIPRPRETIEVFFFQTEETYRKFLAVEFPDAPFDRRSLYIKDKGPGMVLVVRNPEINEDLRHEMTHAFLHSTIRFVPLWLDEGLAEYFEKPRETRATENPYFKTIARKTVFNSVPSLNGLEKLLYFDQMGAEEYCHAWSWVHFMIHHSRKTHETLAGYIRLLDEYGDKTPHIEGYLSKTTTDLKKEYLEHFRNWKNHLGSRSRTMSSQSSGKAGMDITRSYDQSVIR
ncbi:MAG: DUF1570 domain-containing protein [Planctomycetaceae bacterium]|jgi:hypothetical protein|nr:DUF1570 domain-containing protein [Planctomycetaceae bacterium]